MARRRGDGGELVPAGRGLDPWEKRPSESIEAYLAFVVYRDLDPEQRSQRRVAQKLSKSTRLIARWSTENDWVERAEAYTLEIERRVREKRETDIVRARSRWGAEGRALQVLGMTKIRGDEERRVAAVAPESLTPAEALRAIDLGVQIEGASYGVTTHVARGAGHITLAEAQNVFRVLVEIGLQFVEEERQPAYVAAIEGLSIR